MRRLTFVRCYSRGTALTMNQPGLVKETLTRPYPMQAKLAQGHGIIFQLPRTANGVGKDIALRLHVTEPVTETRTPINLPGLAKTYQLQFAFCSRVIISLTIS